MFGNSKMKQMVREADKIVSLKQDMDSLSWGRVQEIAKELQGQLGADEAAELGRELAVIAQINLSMFSRMGVIPQTMWPSAASVPVAANAAGTVVTDDDAQPVVLPSGMEVIEGGLVEAVLENPELATKPLTPMNPTPGSSPEEDIACALAEESEFLDTQARAFDLSGKGEDETRPVEDGAEAPQQGDAAAKGSPASAANPSARASGPSHEPSTVADEDDVARSLPEDGSDEQDGNQGRCGEARLHGGQFAQFRHIYESRDGGLCVFKDEHGHLVSVRASRLA